MLAVIASTAVIISAAYLLWAIQRILFNPLDKPENEHIPDLNRRELAVMVPLIACIVWLGVYPAPVLRRMEGAATKFVTTVNARRDVMVAAAARGGGPMITTLDVAIPVAVDARRSCPTWCSWAAR